jgi:S-adenosylmethionine hydrolase
MPGLRISFLSDYGLTDEFVGVCHAVIATICPEAEVIDITHGTPRHDVRAGAIILRGALPYLPPGVLLAVVDPDVGAERRAVAIRSGDGRLLVGPDNGLLSLATELAGGASEAVDIARSPFRLEPVSATFHGRDIFAPVAAALAAGEPLLAVGERLAVTELQRLTLPVARVLDGVLRAHVLRADQFGNLILDASAADIARAGLRLGAAVRVEVSGRAFPARYVSTFADVPPDQLLLYVDATRMAALAVNRGSAAEHLAVHLDREGETELLVRAG